MRCGSATLATLLLVLSAAAGVAADSEAEVASALQDVEKLRVSGDVEGAAKEAAELLAKHPESLDAHVAFQDLELAMGHEKGVLETYRNAAATPEATADSHYLIARLLRGNAAANEYRAALKLDPKHFFAMCGLGTELTHTKAYGEAKTVLEEAGKLRPESAVPVNALGRVEEARGKKAEAEKFYRAAIELNPAMTLARVNLGVLLVGASRQEEALKTLQEATKLAPRDPMPLVAIGMAYLAAKDAKTALEWFKKATVAEPRSVSSLNLLAGAYIELGQPDFAEMSLQTALKIAPDSVITKINLAYLRVEKDELDEALKFATAAVAADDKSAEAHYILGLVYDHQLLAKKAEEEFKKASALDDDNVAFVRAIAALAAAQGEWAKAISEYTRVASMTNNSADALMSLASAQAGGGKLSAAASTYDKILAADPAKLDAWFQLGIVCSDKSMKQYKRAAKAFREYQNRGGKHPKVAEWIQWLDSKG